MPTIAISKDVHESVVKLSEAKKTQIGKYAESVLKDDVFGYELSFIKKRWSSHHPLIKDIWFTGGNSPFIEESFIGTLNILHTDGKRHEIIRKLKDYNEYEMLKEADAYITALPLP